MSESPEEQPSTGVLGRIGSWLSPWRGKGPRSPCENASPTGDPSLDKPELEKDTEESVKEQLWEDKNPDHLLRDISPCEAADATQSAHRDGSVLSSAATGGPTGEELVACREPKSGRSKWEERSSNVASASGICEKNASHLTHRPTPVEQGVAWDCDPAGAQPQAHRRAQASKKLHVYLEETSVIHCGQDKNIEKEVFRTTVTKSLHVLPKLNSSSFDSLDKTTIEVEKGTHVTDIVGYCSAAESPLQKSHKDSEGESDRDQKDSMGRKNSSKKRSKKNSQGDGGNAPQEKAPQNVPPVSKESASNPPAKSPETHTGKDSADSSSQLSSTSQASPEGGEKKTSCPGGLDDFQDSNPFSAATQAVDGETANMEDEDGLYKVERKTETPESKRRSIKVSRSEVKLFRKYVPLNPKQSSAGNSQDVTQAGMKSSDDSKDNRQAEVDGSLQAVKKAGDASKPVVGRLADKINIFERPVDGQKQTFRAPRSADVSPVRSATDRVKAGFLSVDQRSRSAERYGGGRCASPAKEELMTIKERVKIFAEPSVSKAKSTLPKKPTTTGMSQQSALNAENDMSKSQKLDNQGQLDPTRQTKAATLKAGGQQGNAGGLDIYTSKPQVTDLQTADKGAKPDSVQTNAACEEQGDSAEISPHLKAPSRTGSRSKRRKSKEPSSPISPNHSNKPEYQTTKSKVTAQKPEDNTEDTTPESKQHEEKAAFKVRENALDKQPLSDTKHRTGKQESEVPAEQRKTINSSFKKGNIDKPDDRQEGLPVSADEPDTAASETTRPIEKGSVILPQKEGKAEEHSTRQKGKNTSDNKNTLASSPASIETMKRESELDKELSIPLELKSKPKGRKPNQMETQQGQNKDTEQRNRAETKFAEKSEKPRNEKTNQTAETEREKTQSFLQSDESASKSGQDISGKMETAARNDEKINEGKQPGKDTTKPEVKQPKPASQKAKTSSSLPQEPDPEKASVGDHNEAQSGSKGDKKPGKIKTATNLRSELQTHSVKSPGKESGLAVVQAKPRPESVSVEKTENSVDDSRAHGANDAEHSGSKPITKATTVDQKGTVKVSNNTPVPITAQSGVSHQAKTQLYSKESSSVSASQFAEGGEDDGKKPVVKEVTSDVSGDGTSESGGMETEKARKIPPKTSSSLFKDVKSVGETSNLPGNKASTIANGDISQNLEVQEIIQKPNQSPKTPTSPNKVYSDAVKKLQLTKDDSSKWQDAPSSWLDVDFPKRKLKVQESKLTSSGSESNLLDAPDLEDDDFIQRIKNLCAPFSLPPRKHNPLRTPQPPFAMPAIREDRFEKVFDPEEFTIGLRKKKNQFTLDTSQSLLSKHQTLDSKSGIKPARASIAERCVLLGSLDTRLSKTPGKDEEGIKEEADDQIKVKSRLEGSCVLSSLTSSNFRGKRNGVQTLAEVSMNASPSESPHASPPPVSPAPPPSPTDAGPLRVVQTAGSGGGDRPAEAAVCDSGPPLPSFNDMKLPDYLHKYLPQDHTGPALSVRGQDPATSEMTGKMAAPAGAIETDGLGNAAPMLPGSVAPCFPGIPASIHSAAPLSQQLPAQLHSTLRNNVPTIKREFHKRPGKMVLFEKAQFNGQAYEIYRNMADATSLQLSPLISVKVVRGCWVLYEKPDFQGRTIALEEGGSELANMWADPEVEKDPQNGLPMRIGSIRLAVGDYSVPHIDLFTEPEGRGRVTSYHDDTIETGSFGIPQSTASIRVHSGVWLVCSDPGFQGMISVLERGEYPFPEAWGFPSPFVGSLRPLKMGGFKVENPNEVKAVLYEKPGFEGCSVEIDSDVFSFCEGEDGVATDTNKLKSVGSIKIIGGFWVGYSQPGFEGQQHILEEGEYLDHNDWGGSELLSLRPILSDFLTPHVKMFSDRDFGKLGVDIDLSVPIINMDDTGYGMKTQSIDVISGVWVVFEEPGFSSEPYVLEKGLYGSPEDWGALRQRVGSTMPVLLDDFENAAKFKVQLFSNPGFQGCMVSVEDAVASLQDGFSLASCKVVAGSWLAFEGKSFSGKVFVLEEGDYPDLRAMGCVSANASILSLQPVGFEFSLPSITLFERSDLRGKRVVLTDGSVNLPFTGGCGRVQSVLVEGGIWVLYEGINYRGAQILLKPGQVPDWRKFSGWQKIGSLRPLTQKQIHFRLRNRQTGLMMSVTGELDDVKLMRIQEAEETGGFEQIWFYHNGHLHCKLLEECCLSPTGSVMMAGCRVGLGQETAEQTHRWSITPEGFIRYTHTSDLVLEIKGGHHFDKNQVILNTLDPNKLQQRWDVEII